MDAGEHTDTGEPTEHIDTEGQTPDAEELGTPENGKAGEIIDTGEQPHAEVHMNLGEHTNTEDMEADTDQMANITVDCNTVEIREEEAYHEHPNEMIDGEACDDVFIDAPHKPPIAMQGTPKPSLHQTPIASR